MYQDAYLTGSLIFCVVWLGFYLWRRDLRREMLTLSVIAGIFGPLSEHFYLQDYWRPEYFFPAVFRVEDILVGTVAIGFIGFRNDDIFISWLGLELDLCQYSGFFDNGSINVGD